PAQSNMASSFAHTGRPNPMSGELRQGDQLSTYGNVGNGISPTLKCVDMVIEELINVVHKCTQQMASYPGCARMPWRPPSPTAIPEQETRAKTQLMLLVDIPAGLHEHQSRGFYRLRQRQQRTESSQEGASGESGDSQGLSHAQQCLPYAASGSKECWFVLTALESLMWFKDEEEREKKYMLPLDGLKNSRREVRRGLNTYKDYKTLELAAESADEVDSWKASFLRAGVYPERESRETDELGEDPQTRTVRASSPTAWRATAKLKSFAAWSAAISRSASPSTKRPVPQDRGAPAGQLPRAGPRQHGSADGAPGGDHPNLVESYMKIVDKTQRDIVPKTVIHIVVNEFEGLPEVQHAGAAVRRLRSEPTDGRSRREEAQQRREETLRIYKPHQGGAEDPQMTGSSRTRCPPRSLRLTAGEPPFGGGPPSQPPPVAGRPAVPSRPAPSVTAPWRRRGSGGQLPPPMVPQKPLGQRSVSTGAFGFEAAAAASVAASYQAAQPFSQHRDLGTGRDGFSDGRDGTGSRDRSGRVLGTARDGISGKLGTGSPDNSGTDLPDSLGRISGQLGTGSLRTAWDGSPDNLGRDLEIARDGSRDKLGKSRDNWKSLGTTWISSEQLETARTTWEKLGTNSGSQDSFGTSRDSLGRDLRITRISGPLRTKLGNLGQLGSRDRLGTGSQDNSDAQDNSRIRVQLRTGSRDKLGISGQLGISGR
uniref:PH domain-containing protein n=1 Tax=Macrostomum lignano TaxID=282301 RepID=A0A1I8FE18_9PLAT